MSRPHTFTLHRPWWSRAWRAIELAWLRYRRQCVLDELAGYLDCGLHPGPDYLANCCAQIDDYSRRIAVLEINT